MRAIRQTALKSSIYTLVLLLSLLSYTLCAETIPIHKPYVWVEGDWRLELRRKMNTGHNDDVVFEPGIKIKGGVAILDGSENTDHNISSTLVFQL